MLRLRLLELGTTVTPDGHRSFTTSPPPVAPPPLRRHVDWLPSAAAPLAVLVTTGVAVLLLPGSLPGEARAAMFAFTAAVVLWLMTPLPVAWVALLCVVLLIALGGADQSALTSSLASDVVWLTIGAFVLGGAVEASGLAARLTAVVTRRASTVGGVFWTVTVLLLPLSLLIPSTSGRAAVMLPFYRSLTRAGADPRITRAMALLIPTVVLVSTVSTLVGAGSHLIANDLLEQVTGRRISFAQWALYGVPFAIAASLVSSAVVQRMFLDAETRSRPLTLPITAAGPASAREWRTVCVLLVMVGLWMTESAHGIGIATVAIGGAIALTVPGAGVLSWQEGVGAISWNLVVFIGTALVLGEALVDTGAAQWTVEQLFAATGIAEVAGSPFLVLVVLALVTLSSHVLMTSSAARVAALLPAVLLLGQSLDLDPVAVMFIATLGMDYCLTFPVSSQALLLFAELDENTFEQADLLRLSSVLLVAHVVLVVAFYYGYWRFVGLAL